MFCQANLARAVCASLSLSMICGTLWAADGQLNVFPDGTTTYEISEPGSYVLVTDVTMTQPVGCILISSSDVTLDLNGHTISGIGENSSTAIVANGGPENVTIKNGTLSNFGAGIFTGDGGSVSHVTLTSIEQQGIVVGENSYVGNNILNGVGFSGDQQSGESGIRVGIFSGPESIIENNTVTGIGGPGLVSASFVAGIGCGTESIVRNNTVEGVLSGGPSVTGILAADNASGVILKNNSVANLGIANGGTNSFARGIAAGPGSLIESCTVNSVGGNGSASVHGIAFSGSDPSAPAQSGKVVGCVVRDLEIAEGELHGIRGGFNLSVSDSSVTEISATSGNSELYGIFGTSNLKVENCVVQTSNGGDVSYGIFGSGNMYAAGNFVGAANNSIAYSGIFANGENAVIENNVIEDLSAVSEISGISAPRYTTVNGNKIKDLEGSGAIISGIVAQEGSTFQSNEVTGLESVNLAGIRLNRTFADPADDLNPDDTAKAHVDGNVIKEFRILAGTPPSGDGNTGAGILSEVSCELTNNSVTNLIGMMNSDCYGIRVEANSSKILGNKIMSLRADGNSSDATCIEVISTFGFCDEGYSFTTIEENKISGLVGIDTFNRAISCSTANSIIKSNTIMIGQPDNDSTAISSGCDTVITENYIYGARSGYSLSFRENVEARQYLAGNVVIAEEEFLFFGTNSPNIIQGTVPSPNYFNTLPVNNGKSSENESEEESPANE